MGTAALEVEDIVRTHGPPTSRLAQRSHLSLGQAGQSMY